MTSGSVPNERSNRPERSERPEWAPEASRITSGSVPNEHFQKAPDHCRETAGPPRTHLNESTMQRNHFMFLVKKMLMIGPGKFLNACGIALDVPAGILGPPAGLYAFTAIRVTR